jgi:hypothetical protein
MKKLFFFLFFTAFFTSISAQSVNQDLIGEWVGKGDIIVTWCELDSLSFDIKIAKDNSVSGKIGDAEIYDAKLEKRSAIMEALGNGEYIIEGKLKGAIVKDEKISRESFLIMFNLENGVIKGGMHTSGSKFGGKEKMVLTVSPLILKKKK